MISSDLMLLRGKQYFRVEINEVISDSTNVTLSGYKNDTGLVICIDNGPEPSLISATHNRGP